MAAGTERATPQATGATDRAIIAVVRFFRQEWSGAAVAILVLAITIEAATTGRPFFHPSNILTILNNSAALGVVAGGVTLVILTAGIDLSVGSVMGMTAALTGYVASYWGMPPGMAIATGLTLGAAVGLFNGTLVAYLGMPAFIVTLAGLSIWRGAGHLATGAQATPRLPEAFDYFGRWNPLTPLREGFQDGALPALLMPVGRFLDAHWISHFRTFQMSGLIFLLFFLVLAIIVSNTRYGRYVYAIGSNEAGARQAGIATARYKLMTYVLCSLSAAFGALLFLGRAPYAKSDYGQMWELDAIAAVVIGGTSLFGGRGSILGTFMGVLLLKLINNGLTLAQLNTFWQMVVTGAIILIAVGLDIVRQSRDARVIERFLAAAGAAMSLLALMTPAALWLRAWTALHEHRSVSALRAAGTDLAPAQAERVLAADRIAALEAQMADQGGALILLGAVTAVVLAAALSGAWALRIAALAALAAGMAMSLLTGQVAALPLLALGALAMLASLAVPAIHARAGRLEA